MVVVKFSSLNELTILKFSASNRTAHERLTQIDVDPGGRKFFKSAVSRKWIQRGHCAVALADPPDGGDGAELLAKHVREARAGATKDLRRLLEDYERRLILQALEAADGHQRRAAQSLGLRPSTLSHRMKRLGVRRSVQIAWPAGDASEGDI